MIGTDKKSIKFLKEKGRYYWTGEFIIVQGVRIHYIVKGDGPALFLVHGFGAYSYTWRHNIDELAKHFRVYAIDLKGFGLSDKPKGMGYSIQYHVETVIEIMNQLEIGKVNYCGSSMGGEIGLRLALYYPDRIQCLLLVGSSGYKENLPFYAKILSSLPYRFPLKPYIQRKYLSIDALVSMVKGAYFNSDFITIEEIEHYLYPVFLPGFEEAYLAMIKEFDFGKEKESYSKIKHDTLILAAAQDHVIPIEHCKKLHQEIKRSILITFDRCGHFLHEEKSELVNRYMLTFLLNR